MHSARSQYSVMEQSVFTQAELRVPNPFKCMGSYLHLENLILLLWEIREGERTVDAAVKTSVGI